MTHAFYPGSFDPFTNGHLDVLLKAMKLFDKVTVGVFQNPQKENPFLPIAKRADLVLKSITPKGSIISPDRFNVMMCHEGVTVDVCNQIGATIMIRGLRSVTDYEYELQLAMANKLLDSNIETVFVVPDIENQFVSSTIVRELYRLQKFDQLKKIVPTPVYEYLFEVNKAIQNDPELNFLKSLFRVEKCEK